ncbi:hypothetical protein GTP41_20885 [Pseudoduganella sp. DS3]|uniref:TnsA endonuclease N-terminal domain-containing protein n=1 Tax=Pseudoduganella guangdongensis TaxID=2692179 RepID=A0A6N9HP17_9BURK|nr:hypothetical protein [Pseudoduganella guangdongensis]MYN04552.1 hypothetical protein [Pseudoduganella guangdongensis]
MLNKIPNPMGSYGWLDRVLSTPPVRKLKGRTKSTQYHELWSNHVNRFVGAQGRNEAIALLLLEHLATLGQITRFKEQPFVTEPEEFGHAIIPDFLAIDRDKKIYVIEVKNSRFITAITQANLDRNKQRFSELGITYVCWTDHHPLSLYLRHNLVEMRRVAQLVPQDETQELRAHLVEHGPTRFFSLVDAGFDQGCVLAAAWRGEAYFPVQEAFGPETSVSHLPIIDLAAIALGTSTGGHGWWEQLSRA